MKRMDKEPPNVPRGLKSPVELTPGSDFGRSIRMFRASEGLTQADLEKSTGVNRANLSAYETCLRRPRPATVARIMAVVGSRAPKVSGAATTADSLAARVGAVAEATLAEVAARLADRSPLNCVRKGP